MTVCVVVGFWITDVSVRVENTAAGFATAGAAFGFPDNERCDGFAEDEMNDEEVEETSDCAEAGGASSAGGLGQSANNVAVGMVWVTLKIVKIGTCIVTSPTRKRWSVCFPKITRSGKRRK